MPVQVLAVERVALLLALLLTAKRCVLVTAPRRRSCCEGRLCDGRRRGVAMRACRRRRPVDTAKRVCHAVRLRLPHAGGVSVTALCVRAGAGTVIVSKGDITVGGIVMKEWQRTPCKLLEEFCQGAKRPMPRF